MSAQVDPAKRYAVPAAAAGAAGTAAAAGPPPKHPKTPSPTDPPMLGVAQPAAAGGESRKSQ